MSNKTTLLRIQRHREFLETQRQDPVTRKVFVAGDRITLCATCLLPFLEESWCAIGGTHCGQSVTTGVEALGLTTETAGDEVSADSPAAGTEDPNAEAAATEAKNDGPKLNPIPIKLGEIPVKLHHG